MAEEKAKKEQSLAGQILAMDDLPQEEVTVPEWGGRKFLMVGMNGKERFDLIGESTNEDGEVDSGTLTSGALVKCLRDSATGKRVFTDSQAEKLMQKNGKALERLVMVSNRINGFGEEMAEQIEKNS